MEALAEKIREVVERCKAREDDPEFKAHAARLAAEQAEAALNARRWAFRLTGVPEEHWKHIDTPREVGPVLEAKAFLESAPEFRLLVLGGPLGVGKSFALAWAVAQTGGRFVRAADLVEAGSFDREFWDSLEAVTVLAIDELGAERSNVEFESKLFNLLNGRYQRMKRTLIATNANADGFKARYAGTGLERLFDRIRNGGKFATCSGVSQRIHWQDTDKDEEDAP
jgi:DNA replication protein DnaC